jgi:type I restriction-modification system DNA methylase subunit
LDISTLETWLWGAACAIRGATDAPKFKDFILPLVFYKRLSDVFEDEFARHVAEFGDEDIAREVIEADHADALKHGRTPSSASISPTVIAGLPSAELPRRAAWASSSPRPCARWPGSTRNCTASWT